MYQAIFPEEGNEYLQASARLAEMTTACKAVWKLKPLPSGVLVFHVYSCILVFFFSFLFFDILSDLRMVRWCIRLTHLTLVCVVIKYHLVQVWQNLNKKIKTFGLAARNHLSPSLPLLFSLYFFSQNKYFFVAALVKLFIKKYQLGGKTRAKSISAIGPKKNFFSCHRETCTFSTCTS